MKHAKQNDTAEVSADTTTPGRPKAGAHARQQKSFDLSSLVPKKAQPSFDAQNSAKPARTTQSTGKIQPAKPAERPQQPTGKLSPAPAPRPTQQTGSLRPVPVQPQQTGSLRPVSVQPQQTGSLRPVSVQPQQTGSLRPVPVQPQQTGSLRQTSARPHQQSGPLRPIITPPAQSAPRQQNPRPATSKPGGSPRATDSMPMPTRLPGQRTKAGAPKARPGAVLSEPIPHSAAAPYVPAPARTKPANADIFAPERNYDSDRIPYADEPYRTGRIPYADDAYDSGRMRPQNTAKSKPIYSDALSYTGKLNAVSSQTRSKKKKGNTLKIAFAACLCACLVAGGVLVANALPGLLGQSGTANTHDNNSNDIDSGTISDKPDSHDTDEDPASALGLITEYDKTSIFGLLKVAIEPVGGVMYITGGGWDKDGNPTTGYSAIETRTIGVSSKWKPFADGQISTYNCDIYDTWDFAPYGLDCAGYAGWVIYNTLNTESGLPTGYVYDASVLGWKLSEFGYGDFTEEYLVTDWLPGDIMTMDETSDHSAHVWIVVGTCSDGSVLFLHSTVPGVTFSGTQDANGGETEATKLAKLIMENEYPAWAKRFDATSKGYFYITDSECTRWNRETLTDNEGVLAMSAEEIVVNLFPDLADKIEW